MKILFTILVVAFHLIVYKTIGASSNADFYFFGCIVGASSVSVLNYIDHWRTK